MIFQHNGNVEKILSGEKTQTRRLMKKGDVVLVSNFEMRCRVYKVGNTYAVQPARGKPAVARIRLLDIRCEDVRCISHEDAIAEGFTDEFEFMRTWLKMHDKPIHKMQYWGMRTLSNRPAARYDAWKLTFELVK